MFLLNHLTGFDAGGSLVRVDRTIGTAFGNANANGPSFSFDGTTNATFAGASGISAANVYVGQQWTQGKIIQRVTSYGLNSAGYINTGAATNCTLSVYGKNSLPANGTDGTLLGSINFNQNQNESTGRDILFPNNYTPYTYVWMTVSGGGGSTYVVEVEFYELL